jgi:pyruvate/2-oxoglutarate dehydrogenase complex dihydrolipoamide acyltransferase (E2) component
VRPVLTDVGAKLLAATYKERQELVSRMEAGDYTMSDFQGGTFTVTNLGPLGIDSFAPLINSPEVAILGV